MQSLTVPDGSEPAGQSMLFWHLSYPRASNERMPNENRTFPARLRRGKDRKFRAPSDLRQLVLNVSVRNLFRSMNLAEQQLSTAAEPNRRFSGKTAIRFVAMGLMSLPLVLLVTAGQLEPSPNGMGTHQQLGLPPCTMRMLAGIRCPGCGMTTSWSHFMHGQWRESQAANLGGFLLAIYCLGFAAVCGQVAISGRMPGIDVQRVLGIGLLAITGVTLATWGWRLLG